MDLLTNILIVTFGFVGAVAAFGGKTWIESQSSFLKCITRRGWVAIVCLVATFVFGVVKEISTAKEAAKAQTENRDLRIQLALAQAKLDDSKNLMLLAVQALPISLKFSHAIAKKVENQTAAKGFPIPGINYCERAIIFDFKDDSDQRVGYVQLGQDDLTTEMTLKSEALDSFVNGLLFGHWESDNLDRDWDAICERISDTAASILETRFKTDYTKTDTISTEQALAIYPIDADGKQLSLNMLKFTRSDLTNLLNLPPIKRGVIIANLAEKLQ
jgi:hypothetical protein